MTVPAWVSDWIGTPYLKRGRTREGCDCLGLLMLVHKARLGVDLPDPYCTITAAIRNKEADQNAQFYVPVESPEEGDVILVRYKGFPIHVGYCIDRTWMLHTDPEMGAIIEKWCGIKWQNKVIGVYRYVGK